MAINANDPDNADITQGDVTMMRSNILESDDLCNDLLVTLWEGTDGAELVRCIANNDQKRLKELYDTAMNDFAMYQLERQ